MSLCAIGHVFVVPPSPPSSPPPSDTESQEPNIVEDVRSRVSDCTSLCQQHYQTQVRQRGKLPPKKRLAKRNKVCKRDPKVPFEEMKRIMRVYGPTKCLRNRTPKESGKYTKILSVKRKFYRWFPDFHSRFVLQTPGNWYKPKIGHEEEMQYREELRRIDQQFLAAKRKVGSIEEIAKLYLPKYRKEGADV